MIVFAGLDWLWYALTLAGVFAAGAVPFWMHGRAAAADAYENGWFDRDERKPLRPYYSGWRAMFGGQHARLRLWAERRWPRKPLVRPKLEDGWSPVGAWLPEEREWAEITADWMAPEARAELAAWVQEMTLRAA